MGRITVIALLLLAIIVGDVCAADGHIWVEGESAKTRRVVGDSWLNSVKKGQLSGGDWISHWSEDKDGLVEFDVPSPADGEHVFWVRANPIHAKLSYKLNEADWKPIDFEKDPVDSMNIADDDHPDLRNIAWIKVGKVTLRKGQNSLAFKMRSENNHFGAIDCFVFASKPFIPTGGRQPGKKLGLTELGHWAFEPDPDEFDPKAMLDLRFLNEKKAGESGWVTRTADGDFALGNRQPVRFWAVGTTVFKQSNEALRAHARFLAKRGVNMVRCFVDLQPDKPGSKITDVNEAQIDQCQRTVAAMKEEGIYTTITPYWAFVGDPKEKSWEIPGHPSGPMFGLLFWDETTQTGYKAWIKELFTRPNPHGGVPLGQEPAVAIFQTQNEDSLLWSSLQDVKGEERKRLSKRQGDWVLKKYGSFDKAMKAWDETGAEGDDFTKGQVGIIELWEYSNDATGGKAVRMADQLQWLTETMRNFNEMIENYVHKELGCKMLINAGNWQTADQGKMLDCERWSYSPNQVMGVNRYMYAAHINPNEKSGEGNGGEGAFIAKGDFFEDKSCLLDPRSIPVSCKQVVGFPFIITESTWVPPNRFQSEGPFLVAMPLRLFSDLA